MSEPQKSAWNVYRQQRKSFWISVGAALVLAVIAAHWPSRFGDYLPGLAAFAAFLLSAALQNYKCPRCGENFFFRRGYQPWGKNCIHCGLPKWEEADFICPKIAPSQRVPALDPEIANNFHITKFLTLVLRDDPGAIHLKLDSEGWADVSNLLTRANRYGVKLTRENLENLAAFTEESPIEWDLSGDRIRALR